MSLMVRRSGVRRLYSVALVLVVALSGCQGSRASTEAAFLKKGRAFLAAKDYSRALLEFRNAASLAPKDGEPAYQMGLAYLNSGNYRAAGESFRRCLELDPHHLGGQLKWAEMMTASRTPENMRNAATRLRELLQTSPANVEASDALAMTEWQLGNPEDALQRLEKVLVDFPADLASSVMLARMKLTLRDLPAAEEVLGAACRNAPNSAIAGLALGEFYLLTRQPAKAEAEIRRAVQLDGKNGRALIALAAIHAAANRWADAEETYRRISALPDKQYRPLHALFLFQSGKKEEGVEELRRQAKETGADRMARTRLIAADLEMGKIADAQSLLTQALQKNPKDTDALLQRSSISLRLGKPADAQKDLQYVLHYRPDDAEAHAALAGSYRLQRQGQNERMELMEALRLRPDSLAARLALARNLTFAGDPNAAIKILDKAPESQQGLFPLVVERNWAYLAAGDREALRTVLDAALARVRHPTLVLQHALLKIAEMDYSAARASAEEVLKSDPQDVRAARIVAESYVAQNQPPKALERLTALAAAARSSASLQYMLGSFQLTAGHTVEARQALERAKTADSGFNAADIALAELDRRQDQTQSALQRLNGVVGRDPGNTGALLLLAGIEKASGNRPGAIAHYRAVLAVNAYDLIALNNLSTELAPDSPDEALGFAQRALEAAPDNPAVQDTIGWIYYRKGIYSTASTYLKAAVAKGSSARRQYHLALTYIKSGEPGLGNEMLRHALQQDPSLAKQREW